MKLVSAFAALACCLLARSAFSQVLITEFMADNKLTLQDDFGEYPDWIEIYNSSPTTVNLLDWALTDNSGNLFKWRFPATNLPPKTPLVVFASNRDRRNPGLPLHTNFKLSAAGGYLGLVRPDGSIASEFAPEYPAQVTDVSFGFAAQESTWKLVTSGSAGRVKIPSDGSLGTSWRTNGFDDAAWTPAANGIGFETGTGVYGTNVPGEVFADQPLGYWRLDETGTNGGAINGGSLGASANGQYKPGSTNTAAGPRPTAFPGFEVANRAARLNGSGGTVDVPYQAALNPNGPFSVELWVRPASAPSTACPLSSSDRSKGRSGYLFYQIGTDRWDFRLGNTSGYIATLSGGTPTVGAWTHLVGVYDGSTANLYVNGVLVATLAVTATYTPNTAAPFRLGVSGAGSGSYPYNGDIDEVAFFNRALTAGEVAQRFEIATTATLNYSGLIQTDVRATMHGINSSAYYRIPFTVTNAALISALTLRVNYDDGFAACLNGVPTVEANAPDTLAWNSTATARQSVVDALNFTEFDLSGYMGSLRNGENVLAIQGLNVAATNSTFLLLPELEATSNGGYGTEPRYFAAPTPGAINGLGTQDLGPIVKLVGHTPNVPGTNDSLTVTCRVAQAFAAVNAVTLTWRVMYGTETQTPMFDDGRHGDGAAGDGVYGAIITNRTGSAWTYAAGQMVRYYVRATDSLGRASRWPLFQNPADSPEYLGTVVQPDYVVSKLPIIHLFVSNYVNGVGVDNANKSGGRAAVFYDGEFYDNVFMRVRGNSTAGYLKKSHRFDFSEEHQFRHPGPGKRLHKTSFTADYPDPTYLRQRLSFWLCEQVGAPGPFYHPVRLQMNGAFYQLANHNDLHGEELLSRLGYDPNGALYNAAGTVQPSQFSTGGFDKKTRQWENNADYTTLANAISEGLSTGTRQTNIFDLLDLPQVINYLAAARFVHENDDVWANMSLYHDNDGDGLWRIIPFDMNLSWGAAYMDNWVNDDGIQVTNDNHKSFPLYGSSKALSLTSGNYNRMYDVIFSVPQSREMFLRRLRTLLDTWIFPPGTDTNSLLIEPMVRGWRDEIAEEAQNDRAKWGWPGKGGQSNFDPGIDITNGVDILINQYIGPRRAHLYGKHSVTNTALPIGISKTQNAGIPLAQATNTLISILSWDYNPASGNQDQEYVCLTNANNYAVDISSWKLEGGISHHLQPGTVIPAGGALYLSPNVVAFRARTSGPRGGMGLFVQGNYNGHLSAWGESLTLTDAGGRLVSSNSYAGTPSLAQMSLRITEIMYNPPPAPGINSDPQQFEYIELKNISAGTLNLSGVRLTNGIDFAFTGSAVTSLGPGETVLVVRNRAAFEALYGTGLKIAGEYAGALNNGGETLRLEDAVGEKILEFAYNNQWYPLTDGLGFSLSIVDETASWDSWGMKESWRASGRFRGSPDASDPLPALTAPILVNEVLAHTDPPEIDSIELFNPTATNVSVGGWFLTDDFYSPAKYRVPDGTTLPPGGYLVFTADQFNTGANAFLLSEYGDGAYLFAADATGTLSGYYHGFDYSASPNGVSFGRYVTSQGVEQFVLQSATTLGTNNAPPRVGPVVISEVMYHPPDLTNGVDNDQDEFIELQNIATTNVPLYCTFTSEPGYGAAARTNTWRLRNAVDYDFPTNTFLAAGANLLVVGFDPVTNTTQLASFRSRYNVPATVAVFGPWQGKLDNSGETIELKAPDKPDVLPTEVIVPYVMIDKLSYQDTSPWPTNADGLGDSLQRRSAQAYGNDPVNWFAGTPSAGTQVAEPPSIITQPQSQTVTAGSVTLLAVAALGAPPLCYQWQLAGTNLPGASNPTLELNPTLSAHAGDYVVVITNVAGAVTSAVATLTVTIPRPEIAAISAQSLPVMVSVVSVTGLSYVLEYKDDLEQPAWTPILPPLTGTGEVIQLIDTTTPAARRFYRVSVR